MPKQLFAPPSHGPAADPAAPPAAAAAGALEESLPAASTAAEPSLPGCTALLPTEPGRAPGGLPAAVLAAAVGVALPLLELLGLLASAGSVLRTSSAALQEQARYGNRMG